MFALRNVGTRRLLLLSALATSVAGAAPGASDRSFRLSVQPGGRAGFTWVESATSGIYFTNLCPASRSLTNQIYLNGSGVAAGDIDGDGQCDLFFAGLENQSSLYRNLGGWKFTNFTVEAGLTEVPRDATGAALVDVDGDGDLDLIVNSIGNGTRVFFNKGKGHFTPSGQIVNEKRGGTSLALADIDGDGDLDLYVANYRSVTIRDKPQTRFTVKMVQGKPQVSSMNGRPLSDPDLTNWFSFKVSMDGGKGSFKQEENGEPDTLFLNDGNGRFSPMSWTGGAFLDEFDRPLETPPFDWGLSVMMRDLNGDRRPDIFVCNDFKSPDRVWLNQGNGRFKAAGRSVFRHLSLSSMGVDVADVNRDGHDDIFVVDMLSASRSLRLTQTLDLSPELVGITDVFARPQYSQNTLFMNRGDGTYAETAWLAGVAASEWSWTPIFLDVDLDGYEDILISTGFERDNLNADIIEDIERKKTARALSATETLSLRKAFPRLVTRNVAFRNLQNGKFADASRQWGFDLPGVTQGMALADLDNDGDMDVICNTFNGPPLLLRNNSDAPRISVSLKGLAQNTHGIGTEISILSGHTVQRQVIIAGGRYLSSDQAARSFAALDENVIIEVIWPSGKISRVPARANSHYEIVEAEAHDPPAKVVEPAPRPLFEDWSGRIAHVHQPPADDDLARQPSLPWKLSQTGPQACWADLNNDGWQDLFISSFRGEKPALYLNRGTNFFLSTNIFAQMTAYDLVGVAAGEIGGSTRLVVTYNDFSRNQGGGSGAFLVSPSGQQEEIIASPRESYGTVILTDIDNDGDLDLFLGGTAIPGKYPSAGASAIYLQEAGRFKHDTIRSAALQPAGLVGGAVSADFNGDGWNDLLLACQWSAPRIFLNTKTSLVERTESFGLASFVGLWSAVAVGDFDNNGRVDFVAANWGRNSNYELHREKGVRLYYGDFNGDGLADLIEASYDAGRGHWAPVRGLQALRKTIPELAQRFTSHAQFAGSSIQEVLGPDADKASWLSASWLDTTVFLNRGDHFDAAPLPLEAQYTPVSALCVNDFDGDGNQEVFLAQNFFAVRPETTRFDAGCGLLLKGDGKGAFKPLSAQESGVAIHGQQAACGFVDFDHDGRLDLIVTQTGGETKLFHNKSASAN